MSSPIKVDFCQLCQYIFVCCVGQVACTVLLVKSSICLGHQGLGYTLAVSVQQLNAYATYLKLNAE
jgi:hypothetical protein